MIVAEKDIAMGWKLDNSYARLPKSFFSILNPTPVSGPKLIVFNEPLAETLGLNIQKLQSEAGVAVLAGNQVPAGTVPLAQAYAGHQFGYFTMLGDGRALLIGEQITPAGERVDIQLKGSGRTPYSRGGDGRAALGPMLREYVISEAMHALGIPTTRSLAVVTTGETVIRETKLPGAILTRVAASHLRVGTFQYAANWCTIEELKALADYALARHFPEVKDDEQPYLRLLEEVVKGQATLISKWQLVGFIHGVMNTDNMTISGETIDYGPCAFMDTYSPATVFSSIDRTGRYAYGNQPAIGEWNLARFAESILPLLHDDEEKAVQLAEETIAKYAELYEWNWLNGMRAKLGIFNEESEDKELVNKLLNMMEKYGADFTNTFRSLTLDKLDNGGKLFKSEDFAKWQGEWKARLSRQEESPADSKQLMQKSNPAIIPRNHRVEAALEAAVKDNDLSLLNKLLKVLARPYDYLPEQEEYIALPEPSNIPYRTFCGT
jgi:uncharacterized protein YdiU (UPF0061 family)